MTTAFRPSQVPEESPTVSGPNAPDTIPDLEESAEHNVIAGQKEQAFQSFLHQERQDGWSCSHEHRQLEPERPEFPAQLALCWSFTTPRGGSGGEGAVPEPQQAPVSSSKK